MKLALVCALLCLSTVLATPQVVEQTAITFGDCPTPSLSLSVSSLHPGDNLTISAVDFVANTTLLLIIVKKGLPTSPVLRASPNTDDQGAFTLTATIPKTAAPALYNVVAVSVKPCGSGQLSARADLEITAALKSNAHHHLSAAEAGCPVPIVTLAAQTVAAGGSVRVTVSGLAPSTVFFLRMQRMSLSPLVAIQETASAAGDITVDLQVPATAPAADYSVNAAYVCDGAHVGTRVPITVIRAMHHAAAPAAPHHHHAVHQPHKALDCPIPALSLDVSSIASGNDVQVKVTGLVPSVAYILRVAKRGLSPLVTLPGVADGNGDVSVAVHIPANAPAGSYAVGVSTVCNNQPVMAQQPLQITVPAPTVSVM